MATQPAFSSSVTLPADTRTVDDTDRILQEITAVGWRLEAMDLKISDLSTASASIRTDIACFCEKVTDLDQRLMTVKEHVGMVPEHDAELRTLRAKITDLEDRTQRDNVRFFGIPEHKEGTNTKAFLKVCSSSSLAWTSHHRSNSRECRGSVLFLRQPLGDLTLSSHVFSVMIKLAWLPQRPGLKVHTLWRAMRSECSKFRQDNK
ncbi:hypothetical protein NDU88_005058 [Pleurodeles waltl]|uniref:Uncharacterized protein n=1 Tax=Pleurodeles waltl TaxID=8319 RepID=A0AAV7NR50_PLEWA|nr:hypothetical protein NDU88_005058 [Pleurodeles waltl]